MNRTTLLLAGAVVVVGVAAGLLLAAAGPAPGPGALVLGQYRYGDGTIVAGSTNAATDPVALYVVERQYQFLGGMSGGGTSCYVVAPIRRYAAEGYGAGATPARFAFPGGIRSDLLVLGSSVEAAPGAAVATGPADSTAGCLPGFVGLSSSTPGSSLIGKTLVREDRVWPGCQPSSSSSALQEHAGYLVTGYGTQSVGGQSVAVFTLNPGVRDANGAWRYWNKALVSPAPFVLGYYHPIN